MDKVLRFEAILDSNIEKVNPLFSKVKIKIAYSGANRNNSYISKETFEKAIPTIYNCPIIGEFVESIEDFGSHGGKLEISDKGIKYVHTTRPYGVINDNSEITWEDVLEEDGTINTYLCATGYLWTGRYDELESIINTSKSQSMEIEVNSGELKNIDGKQLFAIDDFIFSAFCILGDSTEPCFESSDIVSYSLNKEEFKKEFSIMLGELKQFNLQNQSPAPRVDNINFSKKEDKKLDERLELLKKYNLTKENISFNIEELSLEEIESKIKEDFALLASQKQEEIANALRVEKYVDRWGDEYSRYSYVDHSESEIFAYDRQDNWNLYGFNYSMSGDKVVVDFATRKRKKFQIVDFEVEVSVEFNLFPQEALDYELLVKEKELSNQFTADKENAVQEVQIKLDEITTEYEKIKPDFERLQGFEVEILANQRKEAEDLLFEEFQDLNGIEEYEKLKEKSSEYELEDLSEKCFAIRGRKNSKFSIKQTKKDKVKIEFTKSQEKIGEFDDIFEKYLKKN